MRNLPSSASLCLVILAASCGGGGGGGGVTSSCANIAVTPAQVEFGEVPLQEARIQSVTVSNIGTCDLDVTSIIASAPFAVSKPTLTVLPVTQEQINVGFNCVSNGVVSGSITFKSNDGNKSPLVIPVSAQCGVVVTLQVESLSIPPVTAALDENSGLCTYTLTPGSATLGSTVSPPSSGPPFYDIILTSVHVTYVWDDGAVTPAADFPLGGSIPTNGTASVQFEFISYESLAGRGGHTAVLTMTFNGTTVLGEDVSVNAGGTLTVSSCPL